MSWVAVGVGAATVAAGYLGGQQNREATQSANKKNAALEREKMQYDRDQFEASQVEKQFQNQIGNQQSLSRRSREDEINAAMQGRFDAIRGQNIGRFDSSLAANEGMYDAAMGKIESAYDPYTTAGSAASNEQMALLGLSGGGAQEAAFNRFNKSPGMDFYQDRQEKALTRNAAAIGGLGGGNVRKALQDQAFKRAQTDYSNQFNRLNMLSGRGMDATGSVSNYRMNAANALGGQRMTAAQSIAGMGAGPNYIQTGPDRGISSEAARKGVDFRGQNQRDREARDWAARAARARQVTSSPYTDPNAGNRPTGYGGGNTGAPDMGLDHGGMGVVSGSDGISNMTFDTNDGEIGLA